jgi:beta-lactamase class A
MKGSMMRPIFRGSLALLIAAAVPAGASAQAEHLAILRGNLQNELSRISQETQGVLGVAAIDLTTGEQIGVNESLIFPQGSAIKISLLMELYRQDEAGRLKLSDRLPVARSDMAGGSGILQRFGDGTSMLSLRDLAVLMIVLSDNTATNMLLEHVGMDDVNRLMQELGVGQIRFQRRMIRPEDSAAGRENLATPAEAAALMGRLARCQLPISAERCADLRAMLEIPKGGALPSAVPSGIRIAWKPGSVEGVATAWGIVELPGRPYAIAAMVNYGDGSSEGETIRRAAAAVHAHFARIARSTPYGTRVPLEVLRRP